MAARWRLLLAVLVLEYLPAVVTGLEANEGDTITLTCPRPSLRTPVVWEGHPSFTQYTDGLQVSIDLTADLRSRVSLSGDHANGYYNLQLASIRDSDSGVYRCKIGNRVVRRIKLDVITQEEQNQGLFPYILNLATRARISTNATCGESAPEYYCKLVQHVDVMPELSHCDTCDARGFEQGQRHPISNAIDGSNKWWQSPSIKNGREYNYVTITLDLGLIYQVAYVIVKAANAPRPGTWILEKSIDGVNYSPWQYFASTDEDCSSSYSVRATRGKPNYDFLHDDEVRCTSYFSKLNPLENGEIFVSLTNGRPGIFVPSKTLLDFTSARYVRLRFQKIRTLNADLMSLQSRDPRNLDPIVTRRYFYSIKDISIGGQCICYGHATECQRQNDGSDRLACVCQHNTCGNNCEYCCPLYNQKPWVRGGSNGNGQKTTNVECEACNCHGHAEACVYNATVDALGQSLNMAGEYRGGGVCIDCNDFTTGVNCERCLPGYYRPWGVPHESPRPCRQCNCEESVGSTGICVVDDSKVDEGLMPGSCVCKPGYAGQNCDKCDLGYHSYPLCEPCSCSVAGTVDPNMCEGRCICKRNVQGENCDTCKPGYYDLKADNDVGCRECFCFGISTVCQSAGLGLVEIRDMRADMDGWTVITINDEGFTLFPTAVDGWLEYRTFPAREQNFLDSAEKAAHEEVIYYWQAPVKYYGNRLTSYGGKLHFNMQFTIDDSAPWQYHLAEADVILQGNNITVTSGRSYIRENMENKKSLPLEESSWFALDTTGKLIGQEPVSRKDFMLLLFDLRRILIRATHHTAQDNVMLRDVVLEASDAGSNNVVSITGVEKCACPRGYTGLSCESCDIGWRRVDNILYGGTCEPCNCYGHSKTCDPYTGRCLMCVDNTMGENCEKCVPGFYGDPTRGNPDDCKPCACPLTETTNNFATRCMLTPTFSEPDAFVCLDCAPGYTGDRCERCDHGFYGYPGLLGDYCRACQCNGNIDPSQPGSCDQLSGKCRLCLHNTEGDDCGTCQVGYYGSAVDGDCTLCECDPFGSTNLTCDRKSGECTCKENYTGRRCERCKSGFGGVMSGCLECNCSRVGSLDYRCHPVTGQCVCRPGVTGLNCDRCQDGFYSYSVGGCYDCRCYLPGTNRTNICDLETGACNCLPNTRGDHCESCQPNFWGLETSEGCKACDCDPRGSYFEQCDSVSGRCRCKIGVTGQRCDTCVEGYYGLSVTGECQECDPCDKPGHICHPDTGECVCPPNTMGERCEMCIDTYWGFDPGHGCKACDCDPYGSFDNNCDPLTGQCTCKVDYNGTHCDTCLFGFYDFPDCTLCLCSVEGTEPGSCDHQGACSCDADSGQCLCKENVASRTCANCKEDSFSLDENNPAGCTDCFCFDRADSCDQAPYIWSWTTMPDRSVAFDHRAPTYVSRQPHGFYVVPDNATWLVPPDADIGTPTYWRIDDFTGDQTLSYNGYITFTVEHGSGDYEVDHPENFVDKPLVVLSGYNIPLMYRSDRVWEKDSNMTFRVPLHEKYWRTQRNAQVTRKILMVILQNVDELLIRGTWDITAKTARLSDVQIDRAVSGADVFGRPALGIEQCECPPQYSGLSCQNPAEGFYRVPNVGPIDFTDFTNIIGGVEECDCNGHSGKCDPETGVCLECRHNTFGDQCEMCVDGYYGDATDGTPTDCQRCACPLEVQSNNFSPTCEMRRGDLVCTACKPEYTGDRCEICADGHYGNPTLPGGQCRPCLCNLEGSVGAQCDDYGRCSCLPGITGDKCDQCQPRYAVVGGTCVSCDKGCTRELMLDMDIMENMTASLHFNLSNIIVEPLKPDKHSCDEGCTRELMLDMDIMENMTASLPFDLSNVNITAPFRKLVYITNQTKILSARLKDMRLAGLKDIEDQAADLDAAVNNARAHSDASLEKSRENAKNAEKLKRTATELDDTIALRLMDIKELVDDLEGGAASSYHNRSGLNVTEALTQATRILEEIQRRDFSRQAGKAQQEKRLAEQLANRVQALRDRVTDTTAMEKKIADLRATLDDLLTQEETSVKNSQTTTAKVDMLKDTIQRIKDLIADVKTKNKTLDGDMAELEALLAEARPALNRTEENIRVLEGRISTLDAAEVPLSEREKMLREGMPAVEEAVEKAWAHANNLTAFAENYEKLFESTRSAAADPLKAANVYDNIVTAIDEAERAARKAKKDAEDAIGLTDLDELQKSVDEALKKSQELKDNADTTTSGVDGLDEALMAVKKRLDDVEVSQDDTIEKNTKLQGELENVPDIDQQISDVKRVINRSDSKAKRVKAATKDMVERVNVEMYPKLEELQRLHEDQYEDLALTLSGTKSNLTKMQMLSDGMDRRFRKSTELRNDVGDKLSKLRQSIREAREEANKVKTSLQAQGKCVKKFRSSAQQGILNTISFAFKTSEPERDMMIVLIQNQAVNSGDRDREFLSVEIRNRKVRFSWNAGGGTAFVEDNKNIASAGTQINEAPKWYMVKAQRIGILGRLTVHRLSEKPSNPQTASSPVGFSVMMLDETSDLYVSGVPADYLLPTGLTNFNFSGCMGSMKIDDQPLGLFNFETNTMDTCQACLEVPASEPGANIYTFDGTGYAVTDKVNLKSSLILNAVLDFKTYWENASLFFVGDEETGEFMSLELQKGHVVFHFYLGKGTYGRLQTEYMYNRNRWVSVEFGRNGYFGILSVGKERLPAVQAPKGDYSLAGVHKEVFFGGIPPTSHMNKFMEASGQPLVTEKFLGCMKGLQFALSNVNLWDGKTTVGVTEGCKDSGLRSVGFYGEGFAEYPGSSLDSQEADLSVSFVTTSPDALLLLSKNINGNHFYSLALTGGRVEGRFAGGGVLPLILNSDEFFNDGVSHNIAVKKTNRKLELYVDDTVVAKGKLAEGNDLISVMEDGGLFLGGFPQRPDGMAPTEQSLDGCISDVVINGNVLNINKPKQYDKADIGRCRQRVPMIPEDTNPTPVASDAPAPIRMPDDFEIPDFTKPPVTKSKKADRMTSDMAPPVTPAPGPTSCATSSGSFQYDQGAFAFGEEKTSFHQINVTEKEILRNFEIRFDIRTYHQDGLLLYLSNLDHTAFLATQLHDGNLVVAFDRKDKVKEVVLTPDTSITDGEWHEVHVVKNRQRISVMVDGENKQKAKISKRLKVDVPLFVGGVPASFLSLLNKKVVNHSIRGCMRNLKVNDNLKTFKDATVLQGVDRCYSKVENGAHFTGDSYAVFDKAFNVGREMAIDLEFRTDQPEGILATMTSGDQTNALTLQLHDGQVKMSVLMDGTEVTATTSYPGLHSLCDNMWRRLQAKWVRNTVSVQVDDQPAVVASGPEDVMETSTADPLFIGGKPVSVSQKMALTEQGFKGCLRNVKVNSQLVDWFSIDSVLMHKTSCPLV